MSQRPALPKSAPDLDCSESPPRPVLLPHFLIRFQGVRRLQCVCTCGGGVGVTAPPPPNYGDLGR